MRTVRIEKYYSTLDHLLNLYDREGRQFALKATRVPEFKVWRREVRGKLCEITGLNRMLNCDLNPTRLESAELERFKREKWIMQTEPDVWIPFYLLIPHALKAGEKVPAVIAPHGHESAGKFLRDSKPQGDCPGTIPCGHVDMGPHAINRLY